MSNTSECLKGGISIIWTIENFLSLPDYTMTSFIPKWPNMKGKWRVDITTYIILNEHKDITVRVNKLDENEPHYLVGNMFFVNGTYHFEVSRHDNYNGRDFNRFHIPIKRIHWEKECLINNGSLTFRINLWDPSINDLLSVEYFVRSTPIQQSCSFQWALKSVNDWEKKKKIVRRKKKNRDEKWKEYMESSIDVPMKIKNFITSEDYNLTISLQSYDDVMIVDFLTKNTEGKDSNDSCHFKLKFQQKDSTDLISLDTGWYRTELYNLSAVTTHFIPSMSEAIRNCIKKESDVKVDIIVGPCSLGVREKVRYESGIRNLSRVSRLPEKLPKCNLQKSMHALYKEGKFCDIMLRVCTETFNCHKVVVYARSPKLKEIIESESTEKETKVIDIGEEDSRIFGMFLDYLYTDSLEDTSFDSAVKLYAIAEKYAVKHLQKNCTNLIVSCLSPGNVCEALQFANNYLDQDLKEGILCYFGSHVKEIENSSSWENLLADKPLLAAESLRAVLQ